MQSTLGGLVRIWQATSGPALFDDRDNVSREGDEMALGARGVRTRNDPRPQRRPAPERLARACAAHPRRTLGLWGVAVVFALALVATSLHALTADAHVVGSPES
jgi:hypothetical protein